MPSPATNEGLSVGPEHNPNPSVSEPDRPFGYPGLLVETSGQERIRVWPYRFTAINKATYDVHLVGRRLLINHSSLVEPVPASGYIPSLWGDRPSLASGESRVFKAMLATKGDRPPVLVGSLAAVGPTGAASQIDMSDVVFETSVEAPPVLTAEPLDQFDAAILRYAIRDYNAQYAQGAAVFRPNDWPFSKQGLASLTSFLIETAQNDKRKSREFSFSEILVDQQQIPRLKTDDHYLCRPVPAKNSSGGHTFLPCIYVLSYNSPVLPERGFACGALDRILDRILTLGRRRIGEEFLPLLVARDAVHRSRGARPAGTALPDLAKATATEVTWTSPNQPNLSLQSMEAESRNIKHLFKRAIPILAPQLLGFDNPIRRRAEARMEAVFCDERLTQSHQSEIERLLDGNALTGEALARLSLRARIAVLKAHYVLVSPWVEIADVDRTPERMALWLEDNVPDRKSLRLSFSDLNHIDAKAYKKIWNWSQKPDHQTLRVDLGFLDGHRVLPSSEDIPSGATVFNTMAQGHHEESRSLKRLYERAKYHRVAETRHDLPPKNEDE